MLIVCPNCATSYRVEAPSLGPTGRSVRCVRCRNVWFAHDPGALPAIAQAHRSDLQALAASIATVAHAPSEAPGADEPPASDYAIESEPATGETTASFASRSSASKSLASLAEEENLLATGAPSLAPMEPGAALPADAALGQELVGELGQNLGEDIETVAARRMPRRASRGSRWALPGLPIAILALVALNAALIGWRADVVKVAPQTASLYAAIGLPVNLRGLSFTNVTTTIEPHDGVQVLVVEGKITSVSQRVVEVPRLRFSVRNRNGQEVYAWTALPGRSGLAPGETLSFRSRLASPPPDAREVLVRFFNRRDLVAGVQ
jgi:predicted Zn finger-like uncharacterized protein